MSSKGFQSFFSFISNNHQLIEDLFRIGMKSDRVLSEQQVFDAINSSNKLSDVNSESLITRLIEYRIIREFEESYYELTPQLNQFLQWLLKERLLFDTGFLQACIDRMSKSQSKIESNLSANPLELQKSKINIGIEIREILEAMDDLRNFTESNRSAIILATRTSDENDTSYSRLERYIRIQRLYDEYVEPAKKMIGDSFVEVCDSVMRTLSDTEKQLFDSEDIINLIRILRMKMIQLRKLVGNAHHDMWNELRTAMKEFRGYLDLYNGSIHAQKEVIQKGRKILSKEIDNHLRMVSIRPRNLFSDIAVNSFILGLNDIKNTPPGVELPEMSESYMPAAPINARKLEAKIREMNDIDDLLKEVLELYPEKSLESCFLAVIEFAEARSEDIELKDEKSTYTRLMSNVKCSKIKVEAIE